MSRQRHPLVDTQRVHELQQVVSEGCLLAGTGSVRSAEAGRTVAAQIGHQHATSVRRQGRSDLVIAARIVGEAVQQDNRRAIGRAVLLVGDGESVGFDEFRGHHPILTAARAR